MNSSAAYTRVEQDRLMSVYDVQGLRTDTTNWVTFGLVPEAVRNQGEYPSCWAWNGAAIASAEFELHGLGVGQLSTQDIINSTFALDQQCRAGPIIAGLEHMRVQGACLEADCPYTGVKDAQFQLPPPGNRHQIDHWQAVSNDEQTLCDTVDVRPVAVSIPYVSGVVSYTRGILNLNEAMKHHDPSLYPDIFTRSQRQTPLAHTVLLIGHGTFVPSSDPTETLRYWIVKNQWGTDWGYDGYGYILWNSSAIRLENLKRTRRRQLTDAQIQDMTVQIAPVVALLQNPQQPALAPVDLVNEMGSVQELINLVRVPPQNGHLPTIILFYNETFCAIHYPNIHENFQYISSSFRHDREHIILAKINIEVHQCNMFPIDQNEPLSMLIYRPKPGRRSLGTGVKKFDGPFTFDYMSAWIGEIVGGSRGI